MRARALRKTFALAVALLTGCPAVAATFTPLGIPVGSAIDSGYSTLEISGNGRVIVGATYGRIPGTSRLTDEAFRWTAETGAVGLGYPPGGNQSYARAVSSDGAVVVGFGRSFRWTVDGGMGVLPPPAGGACGAANAVSADGSRAAGECTSGLQLTTAVYWPTPTTAVDLGALPGGVTSRADGISADGSVVVGSSMGGNGWEAFRWTAAGGMTGLGGLAGYAESFAEDVSADGGTVVGQVSTGSLAQAFRWTASEGMVGLGSSQWQDYSSLASGASGDGSVIVGRMRLNGSDENEAFIWTPGQGMQRLLDVLAAAGTPGLEGWQLHQAFGISDDGRRIVGVGRGPDSGSEDEAFLVDLTPVPAPSTLALLLTSIGALASRSWRYRGPGCP